MHGLITTGGPPQQHGRPRRGTEDDEGDDHKPGQRASAHDCIRERIQVDELPAFERVVNAGRLSLRELPEGDEHVDVRRPHLYTGQNGGNRDETEPTGSEAAQRFEPPREEQHGKNKQQECGLVG